MDTKLFYRVKGTQTYQELEGDVTGPLIRSAPPSIIAAGAITCNGSYKKYKSEGGEPPRIFEARINSIPPDFSHFTHVSLINDGPGICTLIFNPPPYYDESGNTNYLTDSHLHDHMYKLEGGYAIIKPGETFTADVFATALSLSGEFEQYGTQLDANVRYLFAGYLSDHRLR